jgi:N-acetylglucosamine-6-phosphate deacetylase
MEIKGLNSKQQPIVLTIKNNRISKIESYIPKPGEELDYILPGFIDIQVNGGFGIEFRESNFEGVKYCLYKHAKLGGTTSLVATLITERPETIFNALNVQEELLSHSIGSNLLGYHLEGPFISKAKKGAHDENMIIPLTGEIFNKYMNSVKKGS